MALVVIQTSLFVKFADKSLSKSDSNVVVNILLENSQVSRNPYHDVLTQVYLH